MTPQDFIRKWRTLAARPGFTEIAYYQEHMRDLCKLAAHPDPSDSELANQPFQFEQRVDKQEGGQGRADVWYKGRFAFEYKGPAGDLDAAYKQLLKYREALENPPLLVVCDFRTLVIHTNFTGTAKQAIAHYLIRLLFCLFAEDIDLLPKHLFTRLVAQGSAICPRS
jgi:hypothetical protein